MKIRFCTILLALAALLLSACAAIQKPEPEIKRAQPKPQEIQIQSAPPDALGDWNGNVLDVVPVTIELTPSFS
jgi:starvation-inducible outer membrane lipoprotein